MNTRMSFSRLVPTTRAVFILAALAYVLLLALRLGFIWRSVLRDPFIMVTSYDLFAAIFLFGSIYVLGKEYPLKIFVWFAIILNIAGAIAWLPALFYVEGLSFGLCGALLSCLWVREIYQQAR